MVKRKPKYRPPGSLEHIRGKKNQPKADINLIRYNADKSEDHHYVDGTLPPINKSGFTSWHNMVGVQDVEKLLLLGKHFNIHNLVLEDIASTDHRPKVEVLENRIFLIIKMVMQEETGAWRKEQISFVLGDGYLLSFQEKTGDIFDPIRDRIHQKLGKVSQRGADYLLFLLLDVVVDQYLERIEYLGREMDDLEEEILLSPKERCLEVIQSNKRELGALRKQLIPLRDAVKYLEMEDSPLLEETTNAYFRDVYDHLLQVTESLDTFKEINSGLRDLYMNSVSNRMNEIMKVLTIISTIFIPLSFLAGVYGMNFKVIPELDAPFGYYYFWILALLIVAGLLFYFKRKKWL